MQQGLLADYIMAKQLSAFWLPDLCRPGTPAQHLFWHITRPAWQQQSVLSVTIYPKRCVGIIFLSHVPCPSMLLCVVGLTLTLSPQAVKLATGMQMYHQVRKDIGGTPLRVQPP